MKKDLPTSPSDCMPHVCKCAETLEEFEVCCPCVAADRPCPEGDTGAKGCLKKELAHASCNGL